MNLQITINQTTGEAIVTRFGISDSGVVTEYFNNREVVGKSLRHVEYARVKFEFPASDGIFVCYESFPVKKCTFIK